VDGLADSLVEAIRSPDQRARMAAANQDRVRLFDPGVVARDYLEVLRVLAPNAS
jgi:hypothetical protein